MGSLDAANTPNANTATRAMITTLSLLFIEPPSRERMPAYHNNACRKIKHDAGDRSRIPATLVHLWLYLRGVVFLLSARSRSGGRTTSRRPRRSDALAGSVGIACCVRSGGGAHGCSGAGAHLGIGVSRPEGGA